MTTTVEEATAQLAQTAQLIWQPISEMQFSEIAQRGLKPARVDKLASEFDLEQLGFPFVNRRTDGSLWVVDGQHRIAALRKLGFDSEKLQCHTWFGLSEEEEARRFLRLNDYLLVGAFPRFTIGVTAGEEEPVAIKRLVEKVGLKVSLDHQSGSVRAVSTLRRAYRRSPDSLYRALRIIVNAYGDAGLEAPVIDGFSKLTDRLPELVDDDALAERLASARGSVGGLMGRAHALRQSTGAPLAECMAAAAIEIWNGRPKGDGKRNLPNWWKAMAE